MFGAMMSLCVSLWVWTCCVSLFIIISPPDCQLQTMSRETSSSSSGIGNKLQNGLENIKAKLNGDLGVQLV